MLFNLQVGFFPLAVNMVCGHRYCSNHKGPCLGDKPPASGSLLQPRAQFDKDPTRFKLRRVGLPSLPALRTCSAGQSPYYCSRNALETGVKFTLTRETSPPL